MNEDYIDITLGDPTPTDSEQRKAYVAQVAGFFESILKPKINHMIMVTHNLLEATDTDRDFDLVLKGVIYSFREFKKWGESMVNEQLANQVETPEVEKDENVEILKETLNQNK